MNSKKKYTPEEIKEVGRRVTEQRLYRKMSQNKLASLFEAEKNVVQRIESGKLKSVDTDRIRIIANYLGCSADYLLLKSNRSEAPYTPISHHELPAYQKKAEGLIYSNSSFRNDIEYMLNYMHPDFQEQLIQIFHSYIMFHKLGVQYPATKPEQAIKFKPSDIDSQIKSNFFSSYGY